MPEKSPPSSIKFYYEKANFFRVIHADGAVGGLTPSRNIFVALYNQRAALPKVIEQKITPEGRLGDEVGREGKKGIFREMEIGLVLTAQAAEEIGNFLLGHAKLLKESEPRTEKQQPPDILK